MHKMLTIYTDGSFKEHGGWAYIMYDDYKKGYPSVSYGACIAISATHAEAIACVKALDNLDLFLNYDLIEICTDQLYIVQMCDKILRSGSCDEVLSFIDSNICSEELFSIANIQSCMSMKLKFKKAPNNHFLRLAHKYAKKALYLEPNNEIYHYKTEPQADSIVTRCNTINCAELLEHYKSSYRILINPINNDDTSKYIRLRTCDIDMLSKTHLEAKHLKLNGELAKVHNGEIDTKPIYVHPLENGRYELISGFKSYCIAKILGVEYVPCVIINANPLSEYNCIIV